MKPSEIRERLRVPTYIEEAIASYGEAGVVFFTEPNSSNMAWRWSFFMCFCTLVNVIFLILSSMDGPNNYEDRPNMATYPKLLSADQYHLAASVVWSPMLFDAFMRILSVSAIYLFNEEELSDFSEDTFKVILFFMDILSVIPFIFLNGYYYPKDSNPNTFSTLLFRCLELLSSAKILRGTKDLPAVLAIRITLVRALPHLILPIFFFLVFNIFFGVVVYFMEPCYNYSTCAWGDLFEASFYTVVSMTTTGYGNQVPMFLPARFIGVIIMLFGAVFMSMPLAIIGNEYADAWSSLKSEKTIETIDSATDNLKHSLPLQVGEEKIKTTDSTSVMLRKMSSTEVKKEAYTLAQQALLSPLIECRKNLDSSVANLGILLRPAKKMNPAILLAMCELRGWIAPLLWNIRVALRTVDRTTQVEASESRKLSVFRSVMNGNDLQTPLPSIPTNSVAPLSGIARQTPKPAVSQASSLGALQEAPEEDEDKPEMTSPSPLPSPTQVSNQNASIPPVRKVRAPTGHPGAVGNNSHMSAVKKFLSSGIKPLPASTSTDQLPGKESTSGVPLRPSFWPLNFWGGGGGSSGRGIGSGEGQGGEESSAIQLQNRGVDGIARVSPSPSSLNSQQQNQESDDEKSGEELSAAVAPEPSSHDPLQMNNHQQLWTRPGQQTITNRDDFIKQIKLNRAMGALQKQPSLGKITKQRSMESMTFLIKLAKAAPDIAKMRGNETEFSRNMERAVQHPKALQTKLWMLVELPSSSRAARWIQMYLLFLIMLSVLILYTQTLPSFASYSESDSLCGRVLDIYCSDKNDPTLDPGCFVQTTSGTTNEKLKYDCTASNCFSHGVNFGAKWTNLTCANIETDNPIRPFQSLESLIYNFRAADFTVPREKMHKIQDVCYRIECRHDSPQIVEGNLYWLPLEVLINISFTIEIIVRVMVAFSWSSFFLDLMNIFDILSVIPFYLDIINGLRSNVLNFAIVASSPDPIIFVTMKSLKVFRLFKMTRHFSASQVLFQTAQHAWKQILGMLSLLVFIVTIFALLLYEVEKGTPCYVGAPDCHPPEEVVNILHDGEQIWLDKLGRISKFASVLDALWFSVVTLSSTGYGDMVPVTNLGQVFAIFLMLFGAFYMTMPLTVVATTFWESHQKYLEKQKRNKREANKKILDDMFVKKLNTLEALLVSITKKLDTFFVDIQQPSGGGTGVGANTGVGAGSSSDSSTKPISFLERCVEIESLLINLMRVHDGDIKKLSVVYSNHMTQSHENTPDPQPY